MNILTAQRSIVGFRIIAPMNVTYAATKVNKPVKSSSNWICIHDPRDAVQCYIGIELSSQLVPVSLTAL